MKKIRKGFHFSFFSALHYAEADVALVNSTKTTTFYVDTLVRCDVVAQNGPFFREVENSSLPKSIV